MIVDPAWRELAHAVRRARRGARKQQSGAARITLDDGADVQPEAESIEAMQGAVARLGELRAQRKLTPGKVIIDSLPGCQPASRSAARRVAAEQDARAHRQDDCLPRQERHGDAVETPIGQRGRGSCIGA